ncbi:Rhodanese-like domain-containing protein [Chiua virens]|nr:Rhodanese-like domain-containing protein [Chiua virens]
MDPRSIPRITSADLADIIKSDKKPWQDYLVVDVRDSDWKGGNIKGSYNLPSQKFQAGVDELISKTKDVPEVIFHCKFSQERGPNAALIYNGRRLLQEADEYKNQQVYVLQGGFNTFANRFKVIPSSNVTRNTVLMHV